MIQTTNTIETVLEHYPRHDATHALLVLLNKYEQLELDPALIQADGFYIPGAELWTVIRRVNQLLGNDHPAAVNFTRDLKPLFDLRQFQDSIQVHDGNETTVVDVA
jgi:hypothetical protein